MDVSSLDEDFFCSECNIFFRKHVFLQNGTSYFYFLCNFLLDEALLHYKLENFNYLNVAYHVGLNALLVATRNYDQRLRKKDIYSWP